MVRKHFGYLLDLFLSLWIWSMTWGALHMLLVMLFFTFFLAVSKVFSYTKSTVYALLSTLFSFFSYWFLIYMLNVPFEPTETLVARHHSLLFVCLGVGGVYACLQILFFLMVNYRHTIPMKRVIIAAIMSNGLAATVTHLFLPIAHVR